MKIKGCAVALVFLSVWLLAPAIALGEETIMQLPVGSLQTMNQAETFYTMEYTADYRLDDALDASLNSVAALAKWVATSLAPSAPDDAAVRVGGGCSAFVAENGGGLLYGRNYDYVQNAQNVLVHCTPKDGFASVSMTAGGWLFEEGKLTDAGRDLSMLAANFHFYLADAAGNYALVEYGQGNAGMKVGKGSLFAAEDGNEHRQVTNFYRLFPADEYGYDDGLHGRDRYDVLVDELGRAGYALDGEGAMKLLSDVYQDFGASATHETQWSVVYDPVGKTARICVREEASDHQEAFYQTQYFFDLSRTFTDGAPVALAEQGK